MRIRTESQRLGLKPLAGLLAVLAGPVGSQEKQDVLPPSVSTTVLVDVVVRDKKGQPVTGLDAADFEVLEDGVPQKVEQFSLPGAAARAAPGSSPGAIGATPDSGPFPSSAAPTAVSEPLTIAFVFDRLSTEGRVAGQRAARQFIEARQLGAVAGVFSVEDTLVVLQMADLGAGKYDVRVELLEAGRERRLGVPFIVGE